ncbi:MAG TPA: hypothetical protein G4N95_02270 [Anaerolineae bacterium]|nr:hypothetical protein [Anaerolineae bacterium]
MAIQAILHIKSEEPIMGELDDLPSLGDTLIKVNNPRQKDGKDLYYIEMDVVTVYWPIERLNFIEILPTEDEEIIGFVRE